MWTLLLALAHADPPTTWVGDAVTFGQSPVRFCVQRDGAEAVVELWWKHYEVASLEQGVRFGETCGAGVEEHAGDVAPGTCRSVDVRLQDTHPVYDYVDRTRLRCVAGVEDGVEALWCKLGYTPWFRLHEAEGSCVANHDEP